MKYLAVFDGTSHFVIPADLLQEDQEWIKEFDDLDQAQEFCDKQNWVADDRCGFHDMTEVDLKYEQKIDK